MSNSILRTSSETNVSKQRASPFRRIIRRLRSFYTQPKPQAEASSTNCTAPLVENPPERNKDDHPGLLEHSHRSKSTCASIKNAPPEILLAIFSHLVNTSHFEGGRYQYGERFPLFVRPGVESATDGQTRQVLRRVMLVCKAWCSVGTEFLYTHPVLRSKKLALSFKHSLDNQPLLAQLVRSVALIGGCPEWHRARYHYHVNPAADEKELKLLVDNTVSILKATTKLESLTFDLLPCSDSLFISIVLQLMGPCSTLRKLTFDRTTRGVFEHFSECRFSSLEVICFHRVQLSGTFSLPPLPRLITARFARVDFTLGKSVRLFSKESVPSLQNLEYYYGHRSPFIHEIAEKFYYDGLTRLHIFGQNQETHHVESFSPALQPNTIRHLAMGVFDGQDNHFSSWSFPDGLQSLLLFVRVTPTFDRSVYTPAGDDGLEAVLRCLVFNQKNGRRAPPKLVIHVVGYPWNPSPLKADNVVLKIRDVEKVCAELGTLVWVKEVGAF